MRMHLCFSKDCISSNANIKTEDLLNEPHSFIDAKGVWEGHLGEIECATCKSNQELLIGEKKNNRKWLGVD